MQQRAVPTRNIVAAVIGNALEWYDFLVFAFMTPIIAKLFFPVDPNVAGSELNSILMTTAIFGVGFFMRPVGGILLGLYGDRKGRKAAMVLVTSLMAVSIALITVAPTYHAAGILAPIFILIARLLQGFSAGGEFGTSTALLIEMAPDERRGFYGSWQMAGQMLALLIGAAFGTLITEVFTPAQIEAWAWRVPFAFGLVIVPIAIYIRRNLDETATFKRIKAEESAPSRGAVQRLTLGQMLARHTRETLIGVGLVVTATVSIYITFTYLVTYSTKILNLPISETFLVQMAGAAVMVVLTPFMGAWSDRVGRRPLVIGSLIGYLVVLYPLYAWLTAAPSIERLLTVQLVVCLFVSAFFGVFSTVMAELFPARVRSVGLSLAYNVAVMIFGGFAQFIVTWLIKTTGSPMAPAYYVMFGVALGLVASFFIQDKTRQPLDDH
ncbi:MFS transporter [Bordetella holmesii]|uniref:Transporter, major facilitator family protein n=2 Tax=Bordetella holmesii TaxID=35814 RepID=A0A158M3A0_9BORD|nr:MFS transporter [Bordetella holmesii]AHV91140.1 sugar (and other) transporter family protein [Bordetella holmesii ATCC 51541]EWM42265.1 sugar (and other) transporter family protein [Bordetella holmesii 41130]EWM47510.1 sugar (and other) transporter family protein [Bordetella holmesii 35009]EWM51676.1 sugar (and other) transporter family protein [Bordetella holmesii 70147]AMD45851.1 MFS transporter [Bordetella holmesii H558]